MSCIDSGGLASSIRPSCSKIARRVREEGLNGGAGWNYPLGMTSVTPWMLRALDDGLSHADLYVEVSGAASCIG